MKLSTGFEAFELSRPAYRSDLKEKTNIKNNAAKGPERLFTILGLTPKIRSTATPKGERK